MMNPIVLGATALMLAVPAVGQMQAPPIAPMAQRMEMTQTRDQAVAKVRDHFARMDANRDGFVAADEMQSMRGHRGGMGERRGRGNRMAQNGGRGANPGAAFDRLDANRDNMISREEFGRAREIRNDRRAERKMHRMGGMGGGRMMRLADLDRDGRVSLQEATTSALQRFDRIDANRDGRITSEERLKQREMRRQMRGNRAG